MSGSLWPHGLQHARLPCPLPSPGACSNSCPLSWWCHPTILSSVIPFSSCHQSFPASGSFLMSQLFASGGQNTGALTSASVLPMNIQDWFPLGWTGSLRIDSYKRRFCLRIFCLFGLPWQNTIDGMTHTIEINFLRVLKATSPRSRCWLIPCLVKAFFLPRARTTSHSVPTWQSTYQVHRYLCTYQGTSPVGLGPHPYDLI